MTGLEDSIQQLNQRQREAVLHNGNSLLILAGAGSGKTRVVTVKIAWLIKEMGVDPRSILAVTFTNKAAAEMRERAELLCDEARDVVIRTFHSFGAWLLRRNAASMDLPSGFTIYDDDDSLSLLSSLFPEHSKPILRQHAFHISRAKDSCLSPDDDVSVITPDPDFRHIYRTYENRIREIGNVDFGDLILRPIELLEKNDAIARRIRQRFSVILVDEYQDSNTAQYRLLTRLYEPGSYICVVGDDDQSIYRFRGAEVRNILNFPRQFEGTDIIKLEQNYRSTNPILQVAGAVVSNNEGRMGKELWTDRDDGEKPVIAYLADQDSEVDYVVNLIRDGYEGETAILYRTNAQSRLFETRFLREGIPYKIIGTLRFYEREEVKDAIALLKLAANPRDEVACNRIINKPARGIGKTALSKVYQNLPAARGNFIHAAEYAMASANKKTSTGFSQFVKLMESAAEMLDTSADAVHLGDIIEVLLESSGLAKYHMSQDEIAGSTKMQNLEELVNAASLYTPNRDGLVEFLEAIELDSAREQNDVDAKVILITMHNTKGLEFDRVVITGLENELFPRGDEGDSDEIEEERRLFYVSITRARHALHITTCASRRIHGRTLQLGPSMFLAEIPSALVEVKGKTRRRSSSYDYYGYTDNRSRREGMEYDDYSRDPLADEDPWGSWNSNTDPYASAQSKLDENQEYAPGQLVYHDEYGTGEVIKSTYNGTEEVILVRFESGATAQFIPSYTPIEKISR